MLDRWLEQTDDPGPELAEAYESDIETYLQGRESERRGATLRNIELLQAWAAEGR